MPDLIWKIPEDGFYCLYNCLNGVTVYIPNEYQDSEKEILAQNNFYHAPNYMQKAPAIRICLNLTSNCNFRCHYCFNPNKKERNLSFEDCRSFIDRVSSSLNFAQVIYVDMSGSGEPLLRLPLILQVSDYCRTLSDRLEKNVIPMFVSNGSLLTKEIADNLQKHKVLFGISVDGYQEYHDRFRIDAFGKGTYKQVMKNYLGIENKTFIGGAMTFSTSDVDILKAYKNMLALFETVSIRPARINYEDFDFTDVQKGYSDFCDLLLEEAKENKINWIKQIVNGDDYFGDYIKKVLLDACQAYRCDIGMARIALGSDKHIYGCSASVDLESMQMSPSLSKMSIGVENLSFYSQDTVECNKCLIKNACGGECPIMIKEGHHNTKLCSFRKFLFELAEKLCGFLFLKHRDLYLDLFRFTHAAMMREHADNELLDLLHKTGGHYSYTELKDLKDSDPSEFSKLLSQK